MGIYAVLACVGVAFGALGLVLVRPELRRWLTVVPVLVLSGLLLVGAAITPPRFSEDLWAYAMYGRIVVEHRANPYVQTPSDYPDDPLADRVVIWRDTTARYGPVFIGITAGVAAVAGTAPLPTRLAYQLMAGLAVFLALLLIARTTRSAAAVAAVGLNPVSAYIVVNGGHNDALVGLGILGGVLLAYRERHTLSALAFTAAVLVKATAGIALVAYLAWLLYKRGPGAVVRPALVSLGIALPMLLVVGVGNVSAALAGAGETVLPHSPWNLVAPGAIPRALGLDIYEPVGSLGRVWVVALVVSAVLAAVLILSRVRYPTPLDAVTGALLASMFVASYNAPWFAALVLPVLVLRRHSRMTWYALAFFAVLMLDELVGRAAFPDLFSGEENLRTLLATWVNTLAIVAGIVGAVLLLVYRRSDPPPADASLLTPPVGALPEGDR